MPREYTVEKLDHQDPNAKYNTKQWRNFYFHNFTTSFCYEKDVAEKLTLEIDDVLRIRLREARSNEEIFTFSKKIIKFRLGGRAHSLTLLEFNRRLGLYQVVEPEEEGFNVYFEGGLRNDDNINAQDYWLSNSQEDNLGLSRSHTSTIRNPNLRVIYKIITHGLFQRTTGHDKIQKNDLWLLKDPKPGVPRVGIPRPPRASMQDLYDRIGRIEIRHDTIEQMEYRQSYHLDRYQGVFEHMAGVYSVPLQGAYNPPGYAQP
nr:hypothetical protein [Tanacetum cinerariifolium]